MPELTKDVAAVLTLYAQTKRWGRLPCAGGLLDQPLRIMELLDVAEAEAERWRAKRIEDEENESGRQAALKRLG